MLMVDIYFPNSIIFIFIISEVDSSLPFASFCCDSTSITRLVPFDFKDSFQLHPGVGTFSAPPKTNNCDCLRWSRWSPCAPFPLRISYLFCSSIPSPSLSYRLSIRNQFASQGDKVGRSNIEIPCVCLRKKRRSLYKKPIECIHMI